MSSLLPRMLERKQQGIALPRRSWRFWSQWMDPAGRHEFSSDDRFVTPLPPLNWHMLISTSVLLCLASEPPGSVGAACKWHMAHFDHSAGSCLVLEPPFNWHMAVWCRSRLVRSEPPLIGIWLSTTVLAVVWCRSRLVWSEPPLIGILWLISQCCGSCLVSEEPPFWRMALPFSATVLAVGVTTM
jgi:hypothetical protein